eukprot:scaffold111315_cov75-Phaeocystis_antarctica.AAC.3
MRSAPVASCCPPWPAPRRRSRRARPPSASTSAWPAGVRARRVHVHARACACACACAVPGKYTPWCALLGSTCMHVFFCTQRLESRACVRRGLGGGRVGEAWDWANAGKGRRCHAACGGRLTRRRRSGSRAQSDTAKVRTAVKAHVG